jgi:hypothetical protein
MTMGSLGRRLERDFRGCCDQFPAVPNDASMADVVIGRCMRESRACTLHSRLKQPWDIVVICLH